MHSLTQRFLAGLRFGTEQAATLRDMLAETSSDEAKFCEAMACESLESMPAGKFDAAKKAIEKKAQQLAKAA